MCSSGKIRYKSWTGAVIALKRVKNLARSCYRCEECKGYHLGNSKLDWKFQARLDQLLKR